MIVILGTSWYKYNHSNKNIPKILHSSSSQTNSFLYFRLNSSPDQNKKIVWLICWYDAKSKRNGSSSKVVKVEIYWHGYFFSPFNVASVFALFANLECIDKRFWTVVKNCGSLRLDCVSLFTQNLADLECLLGTNRWFFFFLLLCWLVPLLLIQWVSIYVLVEINEIVRGLIHWIMKGSLKKEHPNPNVWDVPSSEPFFQK